MKKIIPLILLIGLLASCAPAPTPEPTRTPAPPTETAVPPTPTSVPTETPAPTITPEPTKASLLSLVGGYSPDFTNRTLENGKIPDLLIELRATWDERKGNYTESPRIAFGATEKDKTMTIQCLANEVNCGVVASFSINDEGARKIVVVEFKNADGTQGLVVIHPNEKNTGQFSLLEKSSTGGWDIRILLSTTNLDYYNDRPYVLQLLGQTEGSGINTQSIRESIFNTQNLPAEFQNIIFYGWFAQN